MQIADRIPIVLFIACLSVAFAQTGGQIGAIYSDLSFPGQHLVLLSALLGFSIVICTLIEPLPGAWRWLDVVLFATPIGLVMALFDPLSVSGALMTIAFIVISALTTGLIYHLPPPTWRRLVTVATLTMLSWLCLHLLISASAIELPRQMGTVLLVVVFFGFSVIGLQVLLRLRAVGVVLFAVLVATFFLNENEHEFRRHDPAFSWDGSELTAEVSVQEAFHVWLTSRNDLEAYRSRDLPYPVILVTSEGGGGFAAAHAYLFLSKMQRRCPNFAQHIFAMVGVSGGAVGNTMFAQNLPTKTNVESALVCDDGKEIEDDFELLSADHLSPVIAALLYHDFPNKLLFGALGPWNRSAALSHSIEESLYANTDLFFDHFWDPAANGGLQLGERPAIIDVATNAISGKRYVFAPFRFSFPRSRFEEAIFDLNWEGPDEFGPRLSDVRFIDAAVASASFPYVTPGLVLEGALHERISLVDGGYLENSGAATLRDIVAELQEPNPWFEGATNFGVAAPETWSGTNTDLDCLVLQYLPVDPTGRFSASTELDDDPCRVDFTLNVVTIRSDVPYRRSSAGSNFFLDPVRALLSTRWRRAETSRHELLLQMCGGTFCAPQTELPGWRFYESVVSPEFLTLPLGWYMPREIIDDMNRYVAPPSSEQFDLDELDGANLAEVIDWQFEVFGTMADNPESVGNLERLFDVGAD